MDTYQSSLKQSTVLSAFKGYLVECPFLTTNSTMNYHTDAWLPVKHLPIFLEASGKSQCPSTCMFFLSQIPPHKTGLKKGTDEWHFPYETCPAGTYFLYSLLPKEQSQQPII